ncbi:PREDICTED: uncharacterized protein LOC108556957 isoform X2 [Nicrophorus vespilloides]|uniref:Uncharacterized protein LOC108556957 isoform X2 n=1 Tax=Nicrophorus vespilloides TaxID=110193 RepID=A0ABM1M2L5_NICVS|nr:PREDICTED: uncharacterized protein LOC108556957 isoform X2 [Nicrophorus vespilloides]
MYFVMEWSNDTVMRFLDIYENESIVWDPSHAHHKNRNEVHDAWRRIQADFGENISITDLKKKKDSLMATFRNCLYKIKQTARTSTSNEIVYKPSWFAYPKMASFLIHNDTNKYTMNADNMELVYVDEESEPEEKVHTDEFVSILRTEQLSPVNTPKMHFEPQRKKKKDDIFYDKLNKNLHLKEKDECELFGELTAIRLRKMDHNQREYVMHEIENVMYKCDGKSATMSVLAYLQNKKMNEK